MRPPLEIRIEELVVVGLDVDREQLGPAVEAALAARLDGGRVVRAAPSEVERPRRTRWPTAWPRPCTTRSRSGSRERRAAPAGAPGTRPGSQAAARPAATRGRCGRGAGARDRGPARPRSRSGSASASAHIRVRVDEQAAARTRPRGSRGVLAGDTIWLDPARYDPRRADGRALLAHEAAHAAQRAETRLRPDRRAPSLAEAEREAAAVAEAVREGRVPRRPGATLPPGVEAADTGATALAERAPALDEVPRPARGLPLVAARARRAWSTTSSGSTAASSA